MYLNLHFTIFTSFVGRPEEKASDLWALGCILYHFLTGEFPFQGANDHRVFQKIQALDFQFPTAFDPVAKDLVRKLIVLDPANRLGRLGWMESAWSKSGVNPSYYLAVCLK